MSQYRPLKEDKSQAAALAVATRVHCLMRGVFRLFGLLASDLLAPQCRYARQPGYSQPYPLSLCAAGGGRFEQLTLPSGQSRVPL
jgi:hypothetical protein